MNEVLLEYINILLESSKNQYIRFGLWPENERSKRGVMASKDEDWEDFEDGVSVYNIAWNSDVDKWEIHGGNLHVTAVTLMNFIGMLKRGSIKAFLVTGDLIGYGLDSEPLLQNVKKIKELKCEEIYVPELDFGHPHNSEEDCGINPKEKIYHIHFVDKNKSISKTFSVYESQAIEALTKEMGGPIELVGMKNKSYLYRKKGLGYGPSVKTNLDIGRYALVDKELPI